MTSKATTNFEIAIWYDTWNQTRLDNLVNKLVPLNYATRYNLAFGQLSSAAVGGYIIDMNGKFAAAVKEQIQTQAPGVVIYAGLGATGIAETVKDNKENQNRSTSTLSRGFRPTATAGFVSTTRSWGGAWKTCPNS